MRYQEWPFLLSWFNHPWGGWYWRLLIELEPSGRNWEVLLKCCLINTIPLKLKAKFYKMFTRPTMLLRRCLLKTKKQLVHRRSVANECNKRIFEGSSSPLQKLMDSALSRLYDWTVFNSGDDYPSYREWIFD